MKDKNCVYTRTRVSRATSRKLQLPKGWTVNSNGTVVGPRCVVYFKKGPCFFQRKGKKVKSGRGYYLGNIVEYKEMDVLAVLFDDLEEFDFTSIEVLLVEPSAVYPTLLVWSNPSNTTIDRDAHLASDNRNTVFATCDPFNVEFGDCFNVEPGDVVLAKYDKERWFRGRVASVGPSEEEKSMGQFTCDIAYDDGEFQRDVPIKDNIVLMKKGADDPTWLAGLSISLGPTRGSTSTIGKISNTVEKGKDITVTFDVDGKTTTKEFSYVCIVSNLFYNVGMHPDRNSRLWSDDQVLPAAPIIRNLKNIFPIVIKSKNKKGKDQTKVKSTM